MLRRPMRLSAILDQSSSVSVNRRIQRVVVKMGVGRQLSRALLE